MKLSVLLFFATVAVALSAEGAKPRLDPRLVYHFTVECSDYQTDRNLGCGEGLYPKAGVSDTLCVIPTDEPELMVDPCGCPPKKMHMAPGQPHCDKLLDHLKVSEACKPVCRADSNNWAAAGCPVPNDQPIRTCETACCRVQRCGDYWRDGWLCKGRPPMAKQDTICGANSVCKVRCCGSGDRADMNANMKPEPATRRQSR